jgi:hypothetical protein
VMLFSSMRNKGRLDKIKEAETAPMDEGGIDRLFEERRNKDPMLQGRATELAEQLATAKQGAENEPLLNSQRAAFARLKQQGKISGSFDEWSKTSAMQATMQDLNPFAPNYHSQVELESDQYLEMERRRLGIERPRAGGAQQYRRELAKNVRDAGGDVTLGIEGDLAEGAKEFREAVREFRKANTEKEKPNNLPAPQPVSR